MTQLARVCYGSGQPYAIRAAEMAREQLGWEAAYILAHPSQTRWIRDHLGSDVIVHDYVAAIKGRPAETFSDVTIASAPMDVLQSLRPEERIAWLMFERNGSTGAPLPLLERDRLFRTMLSYWLHVLKQLKIDVAVFEEVPHQVTDYARFLAAVALGVTPVVPMRTLPGAGVLPGHQIGQGSAKVRRVYDELIRQDDRPILEEGEVSRYVTMMQGSYDQVVNQLYFDQPSSLTGASSPAGALVRASKNILGKLGKIPAFIDHARSFQSDQREVSASLDRSDRSYIRERVVNRRTAAAKRRLKAAYEALATEDLDVGCPYAFIALQYQPEASTSPLAGDFVTQDRMVDCMVRAIPDDWLLLVKEHPSQFSPEFARYGDTFKNSDFYRRLAQHPRVRLVPLTRDPFSLIDGARLVASAGGTVLFESVSRGKWAANFGASYFQGCDGIIDVRSEREMSALIKRVESGARPDPKRLRLFAGVVDTLSHKAAVGGVHNLRYLGISVEENALAHLHLWQDSLEEARRSEPVEMADDQG